MLTFALLVSINNTILEQKVNILTGVAYIKNYTCIYTCNIYLHSWVYVYVCIVTSSNLDMQYAFQWQNGNHLYRTSFVLSCQLCLFVRNPYTTVLQSLWKSLCFLVFKSWWNHEPFWNLSVTIAASACLKSKFCHSKQFNSPQLSYF